jgi:gliding motility-associated-like protein
VFYPQLVAYNSAGCSDTFTDTIIVYANPVSGYTESVLNGCAPLTIAFTDTSRHASVTSWDFDNDGFTDTTGAKVTHTFGPGLYTVKQKNTSAFGCADSFIKVNRILVNEPPQANFAVSDSIICYGETVHFTDMSTPLANLRNWLWDFDEPAAKSDTSILQNPDFQFLSPGFHNIKLTVKDNNGCTSEIIKKAVFVEDTLAPGNSKILFVSVTEDNKINIVWNKNTVYDFDEYRLQRSGDFSSIVSTSKHFSDTAYMDTDPTLATSTKSYCYSVSTADACKNISLPSEKHCTILLQTVSIGSGKTRLTWNSYTGWPSVKEYRVYRASANKVFAQIGTVSFNTFIYNDSSLCDETYCYYVEAVHPNGIYFSRSNVSCIQPIYDHQTIPPVIAYATVMDDKAVKVKWETISKNNIIAYIIDRYTNIDGWQASYGLSTDTVYIDNHANVFSQSYAYRIRTEDACGYLGPYSNNAASINLRAATVDDKIILKWNKYYTWQKGIEKYDLQIRQRNGQFVTIAELGTSDSMYVDDSVYEEVDTAYCYRIVARENGLFANTSTSNSTCTILSPRIYAPNAFSPNADGTNDVWKVSATSVYNKVGSSLKDFHLQIFDRWGSLVFESTDVSKGWDGTRNGTYLPIGVYIYRIRAEGLNGNYINLKGNITLLK